MSNSVCTSWGAAALIALVVLQGACAPCTGIADCSNSPQLSLEGSIVETTRGDPVHGTRIDVILTGGVGGLDGDSASTTTDASGFWQISMPMRSTGTALFDVVVTPLGYASYRVAGLARPISNTPEGAQVLGPWDASPYYNTFVQLSYRGAPGVTIDSVPVTFQETSGPLLEGTDWTVSGYTALTDQTGVVPLFSFGVFPQALETVTGDLVVNLPYARSVRHGLQISPVYIAGQTTGFVLPLQAGPSLNYHIRVYNEGTATVAKGVQVDFQRTGGIPVSPALYSALSDSAGNFALLVRPLDTGTVIGNITVHASAPSGVYTLTGITLSTFDSDSTPLYDTFGLPSAAQEGGIRGLTVTGGGAPSAKVAPSVSAPRGSGGNGLVVLQHEAESVERDTGIKIRVFGFDAGSEGLPPLIGDYRDHPDEWLPGDYAMDEPALRARLNSRTTLILGNVQETVPRFFRELRPPPIGFVSFDLDLYWSTRDALQIFRGPDAKMLWHVPLYFDDIESLFNHRLAGELFAIEEFSGRAVGSQLINGMVCVEDAPFPSGRFWTSPTFAHDLNAISAVALTRGAETLPLDGQRR